MFSFSIKHITNPGSVTVSRIKGDDTSAVNAALMKPLIKKFGMAFSYIVHPENGDDSTLYETIFPTGSYDSLSDEPTWAQHRFAGWYTTAAEPSTSVPSESGKVDESTKLSFNIQQIYGRWQLPATVVFDVSTEGGTMPPGWVSPDYYAGQPYELLPTPTKSGQVFLGWYIGSTKITSSSIVGSANVSLTAKFIAAEFSTSIKVTTTSSYNKAGIYSATRQRTADPVVIDWGDGNFDAFNGNISQAAHEYSSVGTFTVRISDNITSLALSYSNATWYQTTSQNQYTIKELMSLYSGITSIPTYAFYYCSAMTSAILPSNMTSVPARCFYYCSALQSMPIPSNATSIDTYAFYYCSNLRNIVLPSTLTTIGTYAFYYCYSSQFTSITIPASVTSIGNYAFQYCRYLKSITFEPSSTTLTLGTYAFAYCFYYSSAVGTIDLSPRKITSIPNYCFYYCCYLKGVSFPQGVTSIGSYAFRYCFYYSSSTGTITIPEGVTTISGTYAFANCSYLTAITFPSTLTSLNDYTLYYDTRLATITCNRTTAPTVSAATFGSSTTYYTGRTYYSSGTNTLYVPAGATGYDSSYWSSVLLNSTCCGFRKIEV